MKRITFYLLLISFLLCGCEKVNLDEYLNTKDGYKVSFSFGTITQTDFEGVDTRSQKNLSEIATVLNFAIFQDGEKVKTINQKSTESGFGSIELSLPEGRYQVVAVAHKGSGNATITSPQEIKFANNKITDTFAYYQEIDVTDATNYDANMTRVVSMFRLCLTQEIPADVAQMKFYYTGGSSTLDASMGYGCVNSRQTETLNVSSHAANQVFEVYTFPHEDYSSLKMTISAINSKGDVLYEKELPNVPITIRKISTYTGTMFGESGRSDAMNMSFKADDEWQGEENYDL